MTYFPIWIVFSKNFKKITKTKKITETKDNNNDNNDKISK
jgi:hypothetical protein